MKMCKYCGSIIINEICPQCFRDSTVTPPPLMSATLFDLNPYLKKRLEWRENIQHNTGMPTMPLDPTQLTSEDIPLKKIPDPSDFLRKEKKGKNPERIEF
jgi:rRNA maturation protein Nop10